MTTTSNLVRSSALVALCLCQEAHAWMRVRLQKYEDLDCTGAVVQSLTFPTWDTPGSPCFPFTIPASQDPSYKVWIRDQY